MSKPKISAKQRKEEEFQAASQIEHPNSDRYGRSPQARNWVFTVNNYEFVPNELPIHASYVVMGKEKGELGTPHLQGFAQFCKPVRRCVIQKWCKKKCWANPMAKRSSPTSARTYCVKDGDFVELGEFKERKQGTRMDLLQLYEDARNPDNTYLDIAENNPTAYVKYWKAVEVIKRLPVKDPPPAERDMKIELYYGYPGTGKTRLAFQENDDIYRIPLGKDVWFDGYVGQRTLLLDEFSGQMPLNVLLQLLDKYAFQVRVKGSFVWMHATKVIITTNKDPGEWYDYSERARKRLALRRRFTCILNFSRENPCTWECLSEKETEDLFDGVEEYVREQRESGSCYRPKKE